MGIPSGKKGASEPQAVRRFQRLIAQALGAPVDALEQFLIGTAQPVRKYPPSTAGPGTRSASSSASRVAQRYSTDKAGQSVPITHVTLDFSGRRSADRREDQPRLCLTGFRIANEDREHRCASDHS